MSWEDVEKMLHRAFGFSISKKKFLFAFPLVAGCGIFITLFRALSSGASSWVKLSLSFFPIFVCSSILLAMGIVLIRAYHHENKGIEFSYRDLTKKSWDLMVSSAYVIFPLSMAYVTLWTVIGFFYILKEIPVIGPVIGVLLSFVPFLLILSFMLLSIVNVFALFFMTPAIALRSECSFEMAAKIWSMLRVRIAAHITLLCLALLPVILSFALLYFTGRITEMTYQIGEARLSLFAQQIVTSIPFSALVTPVVIFFFNFSAESYIFLRKAARSTL